MQNGVIKTAVLRILLRAKRGALEVERVNFLKRIFVLACSYFDACSACETAASVSEVPLGVSSLQKPLAAAFACLYNRRWSTLLRKPPLNRKQLKVIMITGCF